MAIPVPSYQEILNRIYNRIISETGLTGGLDNSTTGRISKIIAAELKLTWDYIEQLSLQSDLSTATGGSLDNFGLFFGVPRREALQATTIGFTKAVRFTNLGSLAADISAGTRVFKASNPQIAFLTNEGAILGAGDSADMHVTAAEVGEQFNVGVGEIDSHAVPNVNVRVTNILPIQSGSSLESDNSYRERLLQELRRRNVLNIQTAIAMLRRIPGVKDVLLLNMKRGAGTFDAIIIPYNIGSTAQIVSDCQALLNQNVPVGVSAVARPPIYRELDIKVNLRFTPDIGATRDLIRESIRSQIIALIDNLPIEDGSGIGSIFTDRISAISSNQRGVVTSSLSIGLDSSPIASTGEIKLAVGERLILRSLSVE